MTVYVDIDPTGLAATLDAIPSGENRVMVCGPRPGHGKTGAQNWSLNCAPWISLATPHVTRSSFRGRYGLGGREVTVTRSEQWFGNAPASVVSPAADVLRHCLMRHGQSPLMTPGRTGLALLAKLDPELMSHRCPADVADLLRSTSGQGRFQVWGTREGVDVWNVDARWQYPALSLCELPTGIPTRQPSESEYAPSWLHIRFTPAPDCVGLLGVKQGAHWLWPTDGANWTTWATGAEVHLARRNGYAIEVLDGIYWPTKGRPLAKLGRALIGERQRVESMPLADSVIVATTKALRSVLIQTIGALHSGALPVISATADITGSTSHPEWTTALYGLARTRLAAELLRQTSPLVACTLDGYYVAGPPVLTADNGKPGQWVERGTFTTSERIADLGALYRCAS